jgi:hypothetical protein
MSSLYADIGGPGSVAAAKLAVADSTPTNKDIKVEIVCGDHQNKADVGSSIANQWIDVEKVDMIVDVPNSGVALALNRDHPQQEQGFHQFRRRVVGSDRREVLAQHRCTGTYDTWMLANGTGKAIVKTGGDTWFFLTADYAFGHALERDTAAVVEKSGGKVLGKGASSDQHQRLLVVPAAGADLEGQGYRSGQCGRRHHQLDQGRLPNSASPKAARASPVFWCSQATSTPLAWRPRRG